MEQKKYHKIIRYGHKSTQDVLNKGDYIIIQEKIDGANASFAVINGELKCWSRNRELNESNTLEGFYEWVQQNVQAQKLLEGVVYFGEWTAQHKVSYEGYMKQFFLYDIYNLHLEEYVSFSVVRDEAKRLGLQLIPVFFEGEFESFEQLMSYVGRTDLGGKLKGKPTGEGIVVKNVNYRDEFGKQVFVKLVIDGFREIQRQKQTKDSKKAFSEAELKVRECVTLPRVEKQVFKLIDNGLLDREYGIEDMGFLLKHTSPMVAEDILKEEMQDFNVTIKDIQTYMVKVLPLVLKEIIKSK